MPKFADLIDALKWEILGIESELIYNYQHSFYANSPMSCHHEIIKSDTYSCKRGYYFVCHLVSLRQVLLIFGIYLLLHHSPHIIFVLKREIR